MYELAVIAVIALFVIAAKQQKRLGRIEAELASLRKSYEEGVLPVVAAAAGAPAISALPGPLTAEEPDAAVLAGPLETDDAIEDADGPWGKIAVAINAGVGETAAPPVPEKARRDIETALGTRWAVWVGGVALALGGLFLVRYTIEAGIFGPRMRLAMAALFGVFLSAAGEFVRRRGWKVPVAGAAAAYIPAILTAAGAFTLFGAVFAAHAVYGFLGAGSAFFLLGLIAVATIVAALVHGQALAGIGLLGALATPALVSSHSPDEWALFGYLAIVLGAAAIIARMRRWRFLISAVFVGTGLWTLLYLGAAAPAQPLTVVTVFSAIVLAVLVFIWLSGADDDDRADMVSVIPAFFVGVSTLFLFVLANGGPWQPALIVAMMVAAAFRRPAAAATLHAAGIVTVLASVQMMPVFDLYAVWSSGPVVTAGVARMVRGGFTLPVSLLLGSLFVAAGFVAARRHLLRSPWLSATWAFWAVTVPLVLLVSSWVTFGNIDRDYLRAGMALLLCLGFVAAGEWLARAERPPLAGGASVSCALGGAAAAALMFLHMGFGSGMTTVLAAASAVAPALATRHRSWPVLGWLSVAALVTVLARVAFDPTIVGAEFLSRTPVFNWLLPGYGVPALAFGFAAWQLARTTAGRPRLIMEAGSALFALLTVAMLVRHAMHGGVISSGAPTLAEQAIYTLIALGAGAILISLDMRSPSSVLRAGSLAAGVVSALFICGQHFVALNPLVTDESTGRIPVFNLLFLAYLLPAVAAFALAWYARDKRPRWYSAMLALLGALLAFAYATLSVRRLFRGEHIAWWSGMEQVETYSYSALWLAMGVVLLVAGVRLGSQVLRIASAALISIAVLKVFLFDMSELEGVLRALSFIGLGGVLIGIGLFYQRLLTRSAAMERSLD